MPKLSTHPVYAAAHARGYLFKSEIVSRLDIRPHQFTELVRSGDVPHRYVSRTGEDLTYDPSKRSRGFTLIHLDDMGFLHPKWTREDYVREFGVKDVEKSDVPLIQGIYHDKTPPLAQIDYNKLADHLHVVVPQDDDSSGSQNVQATQSAFYVRVRQRFLDAVKSRGVSVYKFQEEHCPGISRSNLYRLSRGERTSDNVLRRLDNILDLIGAPLAKGEKPAKVQPKKITVSVTPSEIDEEVEEGDLHVSAETVFLIEESSEGLKIRGYDGRIRVGDVIQLNEAVITEGARFTVGRRDGDYVLFLDSSPSLP